VIPLYRGESSLDHTTAVLGVIFREEFVTKTSHKSHEMSKQTLAVGLGE